MTFLVDQINFPSKQKHSFGQTLAKITIKTLFWSIFFLRNRCIFFKEKNAKTDSFLDFYKIWTEKYPLKLSTYWRQRSNTWKKRYPPPPPPPPPPPLNTFTLIFHNSGSFTNLAKELDINFKLKLKIIFSIIETKITQKKRKKNGKTRIAEYCAQNVPTTVLEEYKNVFSNWCRFFSACRDKKKIWTKK